MNYLKLYDNLLYIMGFDYKHLTGSIYYRHPLRPKRTIDDDAPMFIHKDRTQFKVKHRIYFSWYGNKPWEKWVLGAGASRRICLTCDGSLTLDEDLAMKIFSFMLILTVNRTRLGARVYSSGKTTQIIL